MSSKLSTRKTLKMRSHETITTTGVETGRKRSKNIERSRYGVIVPIFFVLPILIINTVLVLTSFSSIYFVESFSLRAVRPSRFIPLNPARTTTAARRISTVSATGSITTRYSTKRSRRRIQRSDFAALALGASVTIDDKDMMAFEEQVLEKPKQEQVSFSHVHLYADHLEDLHVYKTLEHQLNEFAEAKQQQQQQRKATTSASSLSIKEQQELWKSITTSSDPSRSVVPFVPHGRDVVKQLLAGFGFRIVAARYPNVKADDKTPTSTTTTTRSVLVTSRDPNGVQILVTAKEQPSDDDDSETKETKKDEGVHNIFDAANVDRFYNAHNQRPGIAVLGFLVSNLDRVRQRYMQFHPNLIAHDYYNHAADSYNDMFEVYAFYEHHYGDDGNGIHTNKSEQKPDKGTILRFVQKPDITPTTTNDPLSEGGGVPYVLLPGLVSVPATFGDATSQAAYCDHWVSNVFSRTEFLDTLKDTLGFTTKVDFNAGVVAAGEAQIESTVTGNDSVLQTQDKFIALRDQSQVYLPINNALSTVGHVHGFLQELGQGIQHLASRVDNLVDFVQRGNDYREITGEGFTFLRIPRSYYGILTVSDLQKCNGDSSNSSSGGGAAVSDDCANAIFAALQSCSVMTKDGAVDLDLTRDGIDTILEKEFTNDSKVLEEYRNSKSAILNVISQSRYKNLYSLLRDNLSEETYLGIVRNQILVDIQGEDLLYQIFTANILQRKAGDEAPFFEFIQRVCSECLDESGCRQKVRPGCGGFGIRNFLTLFLSIEVSKAMQEVVEAEEVSDIERAKYAQTMVDYFTQQLNDSNPILTEISDAMTEEGRCKDSMLSALSLKNPEEASKWKAQMDLAAKRKLMGNEKLMACSSKYNDMMKSLREKRNSR